MAGVDTFTARALEMIASPKVRDAFDVSKEPKALQERYGTGKRLLQALRLAQAGVSVVEMVPTEVPSREQNLRYLQTKKDRMDHRLTLETEPVGNGKTPSRSPFDNEQD
jgi:hypothetical protein